MFFAFRMVLTWSMVRPLHPLFSQSLSTNKSVVTYEGMQVGENLGLRRKDVNFVSGQIKIERANDRGQLGSRKTKGSRGSLPIPQVLVSPLRAFVDTSTRTEDDALVFRTTRGRPFNDTRRNPTTKPSSLVPNKPSA